MIDHVSIQAKDVEAAVQFYLTIFGPLGIREVMRHDSPGGPVVGFAGEDGYPHFWIGPEVDLHQREIHLAFVAKDRAAVDQVGQAAMSAGAEILHEARIWPEYHPNYYGVFIRDLDGNNVEAVTHGR